MLGALYGEVKRLSATGQALKNCVFLWRLAWFCLKKEFILEAHELVA
jgi:hypothetical protein